MPPACRQGDSAWVVRLSQAPERPVPGQVEREPLQAAVPDELQAYRAGQQVSAVGPFAPAVLRVWVAAVRQPAAARPELA